MRERHRMSIRCARAVAVAVLLVAGACTSAPEGADTTTSPQTASTSTSVRDGAFFLDLATGTQTALSSTSVDDFDSGAPFNAGHYYVASPDGSRIYWEDTCCSASDVAVEASNDGSQGGRVDPTGPINWYAGGWSPDGTKFVYQRRDGGSNDFGNLFVEDMESGQRTRVTDLEKHAEGLWYLAPTFSADGRNVIFQFPRDSSSGATWDLWSVPVTGGEPTLLARNAAQATTSEGSTYAFLRPNGEFFTGSRLVIATTDGVRTLVKGTGEIDFPKMSPDGSRIAYGVNNVIYVVDVPTGESSKVADGRMAAWLDDDTLIVAPPSG